MDAAKWENKICDNQYILQRRLDDLTDNASRNQLEYAFLNLQRTNLEIIQELAGILPEVINTQRNRRVLNTTGTSIGALGAISMVAGVCLSPVTAGASMLFGVGALASVTSGVAAIGRGFYRQYTTKSFVEHIEKLQQHQNNISRELDQMLGIFHTVVINLKESGVNEDVAVSAAISAMRNQAIHMLTGPNGEVSVLKVANLCNKIVTNLSNIGAGITAIGVVGRDSEVAGDTARFFSGLTTKVGDVSANGVKNGSQMAQVVGEGIAASSTKTLLKRAGAITGVIFTAIDIAFLVQDWKTPDPLIDHIENVVGILIEDVEKCERMLDIIRGFSNMPEVSI